MSKTVVFRLQINLKLTCRHLVNNYNFINPRLPSFPCFHPLSKTLTFLCIKQNISLMKYEVFIFCHLLSWHDSHFHCHNVVHIVPSHVVVCNNSDIFISSLLSCKFLLPERIKTIRPLNVYDNDTDSDNDKDADDEEVNEWSWRLAKLYHQ